MGGRATSQTDRDRFMSPRWMRAAGIVLGLVISLGLGLLLAIDRNARLAGADRQSLALATGADRVLHVQLRNIERALRGILTDIDAGADLPASGEAQRRQALLDGVIARHDEIAGIGFEPAGAPAGDTAWRRSAAAGTLAFGPLRRDRDEWLLPMAVTAVDGRALVALFRTSEFERLVGDLDVGRSGAIAILDAEGTVLARFGGLGDHIGERAPGLDLPEPGTRMTRRMTSRLDRVARATSLSATSGYPLIVGVGLGLHEVMAPWRRYAACALALVLLYWGVLTFILRRMRANDRTRTALLAEISTQGEWLQQAQLASGTGVWRLEPGSGDVRVSPEMAALFGFDPGADTIPLDAFYARMHPDDVERVGREFEAIRAGQGSLVQDYRVVLPDGRIRWLKSLGAAIDSGGEVAITGTVSDVTERRAERARLERADTRFRHLFERNPLPAWVYDTGTLRMLAVNDAAVEAYGYPRGEFLALKVTDLIPPGAPAPGRAIAETGPERRERTWTVLTRDGRRIEARVHARDIELEDHPARLMLVEDVGARLAFERDLAWRADHEPVTGLLTLPALARQVDAECAAGQAPGIAVACVQLRDLELIAPTLGRQTGDALLREAALRFSHIAADFGYAGHAPAQTFVVVARDADQLPALVEVLQSAVAEPLEAEGGSFTLQASIGLATAPCLGTGAELVIDHAVLAALRALGERVPLLTYDPAMSTRAGERLAMLRRLRDALERGEFELAFQPIRRVPDGQLMSVEALLRWPQPDGRAIPPDQFIPLCEESGLIVPIGTWVLEQAARAWHRLAEAGFTDVAVAVNVSAVQFASSQTRDVLRTIREVHGLPERALHLELTESVLLRNPDAAQALMRELHEDGLCLSVDDFGTGFSSMAYLRDLPIDHLKIDRAFVHGVDTDPRNAAICRAMIALAHGLGLEVIAEGVEHAGQLEWLRAQGCDHVQGWHLGRPVPLDVLLDGLAAR